MKPFIIAEVGNNHEGKFQIAKKLILKASDTGVDAVKFQTFKTEDYVNATDKKRFKQLKKFEFTKEQFFKLSEIAKKKNLKFISTPFDLESAEFLNKIVDFYKISSGDLTYLRLIENVIKFKKDTIISTGCSTIKEIKKTFEFIKKKNFPLSKLSFLHCISMYPAPISKVNLSSINYLKKKFNIRIGYSDHSIGYTIPVLSALYGAQIIEKHFTLDNNFSNFRDHKLALNPEDMKSMVQIIKNLKIIEGNEVDILSKEERANYKTLRRSYYFKKNLKKGNEISANDIKYVRPYNSTGLFNIGLIVSKRLKKDVKINTLIKGSLLRK